MEGVLAESAKDCFAELFWSLVFGNFGLGWVWMGVCVFHESKDDR